jgi:hypothetical protein
VFIMMRILRGIAALLIWVVATLLFVVSVVLCITLILIPLGIPLMALAMRLYVFGVQLMAPRSAEIKRGARKKLGLRKHGSTAGDLKRLRKRARGAGRDAEKQTKHAFGRLRGVAHRSRKAFPA